MINALVRNARAFQSTPSARRVTEGVKVTVDAPKVSIHTLRKEGD